MNDASELPWLASANAAEAWACCKKQDAFSKAPLSKFRLSASQLQLLQTQAEFATGPAKRKVAKPWNWFWTKTLLEQASDEWTAEETAKDFPSDAQVVDGCCGAGVDSIKIAEHLSQSGDFKNRITAIDSSQIACQLTRLNSLSNGFALSPEPIRIEDSSIPTGAWLHLDPDRRATGRTVNVYATEPSWPAISGLICNAPGASIKVAPGFQPDDDFPWDTCGPPETRRWISRDGSVRQQRLYWRIPRWENAKRIVSAFRKGLGWYHEVFTEEICPSHEAFSHIEQDAARIKESAFVADQDPALRAAGCVVSLAIRMQMRVLGNEFGYCAAEQPVLHPMLRWYRVWDAMPLDRKKIRAMTRTQKVGRWELKSRNVDIDLVQLHRELVVDKESDLVRWLLITKLGPKHICLVCEELGP